MNSISISRIQNEFTIFLTKSLRIHYLFRESTMNTISLSRLQNDVTIFLTQSLRIHYLFRESKIYSISRSRIRNKFTIYYVNSLQLSISFANILWILTSRKFTARKLPMNLLSRFLRLICFRNFTFQS